MLHFSSGRNNFDLIKSNDNKQSTTFQQQNIPPNQAKTIQQQTDAAIQAAGATQDKGTTSSK